jgi:hypothetical protein
MNEIKFMHLNVILGSNTKSRSSFKVIFFQNPVRIPCYTTSRYKWAKGTHIHTHTLLCHNSISWHSMYNAIPHISYLLHLARGKFFPWHFAFSNLQMRVYSEQSRTNHRLKLFVRLSICDGTRPPGGLQSHVRSPYISTQHFALLRYVQS